MESSESVSVRESLLQGWDGGRLGRIIEFFQQCRQVRFGFREFGEIG